MPSTLLPSLSETLKLRASVFFRLDLASPWGMALPRTPEFRFHVILRGDGVLGGDDLEAPLKLHEGEIILLKAGQEHWIADRPGRPLLALADAGSSCEAGRPPFQQGPITHRLMCGKASVQDRGGGWLLSLLPETIHFRRSDLDERVWRIVDAIDAKSVSLEADDAVVLDRLAEALFLCLLARATRLDLEVGRLGAAQRDPAVQRALVLMHTMMDEPWTIQMLAEQAGLSRAALARHFKSALGIPVMEYLHRVRMARAKQMLLDGAHLGQVAVSVGYASAETFRKAFKRSTGQTPAGYLRTSQTGT